MLEGVAHGGAAFEAEEVRREVERVGQARTYTQPEVDRMLARQRDSGEERASKPTVQRTVTLMRNPMLQQQLQELTAIVYENVCIS